NPLPIPLTLAWNFGAGLWDERNSPCFDLGGPATCAAWSAVQSVASDVSDVTSSDEARKGRGFAHIVEGLGQTALLLTGVGEGDAVASAPEAKGGLEQVAPHGNSLASPLLTTLYQLNDEDGNLLKWG